MPDTHEATLRLQELEAENQALTRTLAQLRSAVTAAERRAVAAEDSARRAWALALWPGRQRSGPV